MRVAFLLITLLLEGIDVFPSKLNETLMLNYHTFKCSIFEGNKKNCFTKFQIKFEQKLFFHLINEINGFAQLVCRTLLAANHFNEIIRFD